MANNEDNLIPMSERTKDEQRKIATMGGIASGESRRLKKTMKEQAELLLSLSNNNPELLKQMKGLGIDKEDRTNQMAIIIAMYLKAAQGDVQAFNTLQATIGEKPTENVNIGGAIPVVIAGSDELEE